MIDIRIKTIPHSSQRYPTCGDWIVKGGAVSILVSDMGHARSEFAVGIHEAVEQFLCAVRGVRAEDVDAFDVAYEDARASGVKAPCGCKPTKVSEPGNDRHAPYRKEHAFATAIEKQLISRMGMSWEKHERRVDEL